MSGIVALQQLEPQQVTEAVALVEAVRGEIGHRPLSDQQWLDLTLGGRQGVTTLLVLDAGGAVVGLCPVAPGNDTWTIEVVVDPTLPDASQLDLVDRLVDAALAHVRDHEGGGEVHWWVFHRADDLAPIALRRGLAPVRTLHQMRVALPLATSAGEPPPVRGFRIGEDEADWLRVNNAAFAGHPEQGGWTMETVRQREQEAWFEPEGFLLHHLDGRLAAFCWTKIHRDEDPPLGEIYVIAVDPAFHGHGLGRSMVVAGLRSIVERGVDHGMLYVDHDNRAAFELYTKLGFTVHRTDTAFVGHVGATRG